MPRLNTVPAGTILECDVLIVGSGPAGITIAMELAGSSLRTILLESGGERETAQSRDLLRGSVHPAGSHEPLETNRRRVFGGTSTAWGGRCIPFDPIDFERRPWIPYSGWPLEWRDVQPYFARAAFLCEVGEPMFDASAAFADRQAEMIAGFDGGGVVSSPLERWGPPTNFAKRYGPLLDKYANLTTVLNATVVGLKFDPEAGCVEYAEVASGPEHRFIVRARRIVLACGAIENARLLLASNDVASAGLGNAFDRVGRFYMSHPSGMHAWSRLTDPGDSFIFGFERHGDTYVRRRFWITPTAQRRWRIGNAVASFLTPYGEDAMPEGALSSAVFVAKFSIALARKRDFSGIMRDRKVLLRHIGRMAKDAPALVPQLVEAARQRFFAKRRLPILLPRKEDLNNRFGLVYQTEHLPNPDSRIVLHSERDAFGVPRAEARIAFTDLDVRTIIATHALVREQFRRSGAGELVYGEKALEQQVRARLRMFDTMAHHVGTTRMSKEPAAGVVDENCRVHGIGNLFVAGSSVFTTSSHANPTFMIVALALRLAEHLRRGQGVLSFGEAGQSQGHSVALWQGATAVVVNKHT
ncbi:choline dehydrogenase-like flavoprotein [Mycoplana sp. BE70]|uniref:GMC family oxidoreductase n=1 Tax=Mycoplana sp. BE70 TaxID=2817775 RepID=UPI0028596A39|nr:GMC family oxidoreductase [Mycoplana sp. BE70]MDR6758897.1 choline dehydrogenase-like flavoprotein [Mycoplana sp. BE70]